MSNICFHEGSYIERNDAAISVDSVGFRYGISVFEGIRGYSWIDKKKFKIFCYNEHIERLKKSSSFMGLEPVYIDNAIECISHIVNKNEIVDDFYIRYSITPSEKGTLDIKGKKCIETITVAKMGRKKWLSEKIAAKLLLSDWEKLPDSSFPSWVKNISNYAIGRVALMQAMQKGYDFPLFLNRNGHITESVTACIFAVVGETLFTPPLSAGVLPSITRKAIMKIADSVGIKCCEKELTVADIDVFDEAFLCGTGLEIAPVKMINDKLIGRGEMGVVTSRIVDAYFDLVRMSSDSVEIDFEGQVCKMP